MIDANRRQELQSAIIRAAREIRDVTANIGGDDPDYGVAWEALNDALEAHDEFAIRNLWLSYTT